MGHVLQEKSDILNNETKLLPVEAASFISSVERYHASLQRAFKIIVSESTALAKKDVLRMTAKTIRNSTVFTFLVFGALFRLVILSKQPTPLMFKRALFIQKAIESK